MSEKEHVLNRLESASEVLGLPEGEQEVVEKRMKLGEQLERPDFAQLVEEARQKSEEIRSSNREAASHHFSDSNSADSRFEGEAYVTSEGLVLPFKYGIEMDNIYTIQATQMRAGDLEIQNDARDPFFNRLIEDFPDGTRILNIGCGLDMSLERAASARKVELLHTDGSRGVVRKIREDVGGRAFAANLVDLDKILPARSIDVVMGNSVMGYASPLKIRSIIEQVERVADKGAVFTFDMTPHGNYYQIFEGNREQHIINSSGGDPVKLNELIDQYGPEQGPAAFWFYYGLRAQAVQLGTINFLKEEFEKLGLKGQISRKMLYSRAGDIVVWMLRLAREGSEELLNSIRGERVITLDQANWLREADKSDEIRLPFVHIDRTQAGPIAKKLGLPSGKRQAPWEVLQFMNEGEFPLDPAVKQDLISRHSPFVAHAKIKTVVESGDFEPLRPIPEERQYDQALKAMFLRGQLPHLEHLPEEEAVAIVDRKIDQRYLEKERARKRAQEDQKRQAKDKAAKKKKKEQRKKKKRRR